MSSQKMQKMEIGSDQKARVGISRNQQFGLDLLNKVYSKTADPSLKDGFSFFPRKYLGRDVDAGLAQGKRNAERYYSLLQKRANKSENKKKERSHTILNDSNNDSGTSSMLSRDSISKEDADSSALSYEDINLAEPDAKVVEDLCLETLFVSHLTEE